MKRILLIEDERNFARFVELELRHGGYEVACAGDGATGLQMALDAEWDLVLLDMMLPGMDGVEVCTRIRAVKSVPILIITARDSVTDRIVGLDSGADDYIAKPFAIEELMARMRAALRRDAGLQQQARTQFACGGLRLDTASRRVARDGRTIDLTKREFALLEALMKNMNRVMSRELLLDLVWGYETAVDTNVVEVYVRYLRGKIDKPGEDSYIQTIRGVGYVMRR